LGGKLGVLPSIISLFGENEYQKSVWVHQWVEEMYKIFPPKWDGSHF